MDKVFRALADPTRRKILELLRERERSAGELADQFALSKPTLSGHFTVLREAGLIVADKTGTTIIYRLNISVLEEALLGFANGFAIGVKRSPEEVGVKRRAEQETDVKRKPQLETNDA